MSHVSAHDCLEIGRMAYNESDYYRALSWMQEAYNRAKKENPLSAAMTDILEHLSDALYQRGNVKRALFLTKRLAAMGMLHII